jgi:hypothetical protein
VVSRPDWRRDNLSKLYLCMGIIGFYWVCPIVLNMSNGSPPAMIYLAPALAVAVITWTCARRNVPLEPVMERFHPRSLNDLSVRQLLPLLVFALVCVPETLAAARAIHINYLVSLANIETSTVSANKGSEFKIRKDAYDGPLAPYLDRAVRAIEDLGLGRETIANLDMENPFPALFLAPDPKGVWVWWDFKFRNVPVEYEPRWQEIIGNACIVTEPKHSPTEPVKYYSVPLIKAVGATSRDFIYCDI